MPKKKKQDMADAQAAKDMLHSFYKTPNSISSELGVPSVNDHAMYDNSQSTTPLFQPPLVDDAVLDSNYRPSWVDLLVKANKNKINAGISLQQMGKCNGRLKLPTETVYDIEKEWGYCLIGFFPTRFLGKEALIRTCEKWKVPYDYRPHQNGWLVFKFNSEEDRNYVLHGGPYFVFGRPLLLKVMPPFFNFDSAELKKLPVWINLPGLPRECWKPMSLSFFASQIGTPIQTDDLTNKEYNSLFYARMLVEVDTSLPLVRSIPVTMPDGTEFEQPVFYEHEPKNCSVCNGVGHTDATCRYALGSSGTVPRRVPIFKRTKKNVSLDKKVDVVLAKADNVASKPAMYDSGEGTSFTKQDKLPSKSLANDTTMHTSGAFEILNHVPSLIEEDSTTPLMDSTTPLLVAGETFSYKEQPLDPPIPGTIEQPNSFIAFPPSPRVATMGKDPKGNTVTTGIKDDNVAHGKKLKNKKTKEVTPPPPSQEDCNLEH